MDTSPEIFGQRLKTIREEKGMSLKQLSEATKIPVRKLEAFEYGDEDRLPAPVYVKGYIRLYASELGLNADELIEDYVDAYLIEPVELTISISTVDLPRSYTLLIVVLVFVIAMVSMIGSYYYFFRIKQTPTITAQALTTPAESETEIPAADDSAVEKTDELTVEMDDSQEEPEAEPEQTDEAAAIEEELQTKEEETDGDVGLEEETRPEDQANADTESTPEPEAEPVVHELRVEALEETWLRVIMDDVKTRQRLLKKGDSATWEAKEFFKLRVGNAGGLKVYIDGVQQPPLGARGLVLEKTFNLTGTAE